MPRTDQIAAAFEAALAAGEAHEGATAPNPAVGCALLDTEGHIRATAGHERAGLPHAEAAALALFPHPHVAVVTLEPCNHHGRTGPCAEALLQSGVAEVWFALPDPNPMASGGAARLAAAGVRVQSLSLLDHPSRDRLFARAKRLLAPFATRVTKGRAFVTVKQALDETGSMIPPKGAKTFTSEAALTYAHALRRRADAIVTGSGTVLADRPEFTIRRLPDIAGKSRPLVILDRRARVDGAYLTEVAARGFRPRIATDLATALHTLAAEGVNEVLVEAGPTLLQTLRPTTLWDEWITIARTGQGPERITTTQAQEA